MIKKKQDIDLILFRKDCDNKVPIPVMADKYCVSESTIKRILKEEGITKTKIIMTSEMIEDAKILRKQGKTLKEISIEIKNRYGLFKLGIETIRRKIRV